MRSYSPAARLATIAPRKSANMGTTATDINRLIDYGNLQTCSVLYESLRARLALLCPIA